MNSKYSFEDKAIAATQLQKEKDYWFDVMSGELEKTNFPYDFNFINKREKKLQKSLFSLHGDLFERLLRISNQSDTKLFIILTTGLNLLLKKFSSNNSIILGTSIEKQDFEGSFINSVLILKSTFNDKDTFKDAVIKVRDTLFGAVNHQNYPIEMIYRNIGINQEKNDYPYLEHAIILENIHDRSYLNGVNFTLLFNFRKNGNTIELTIEYNPNLYKRQTVELISGYFNEIMTNCLKNPDLKISDLSLSSSYEKLVLQHLKIPEPTDGEFKSVVQYFLEAVNKDPEKIAVKENSKEVTYKDLLNKARIISKTIKLNGAKENEIVGIYSGNSINSVAAILGVLISGNAYLPIDPSVNPERLRKVVRDINLKVMITESKWVSNLDAYTDLKIIEIDKDQQTTIGKSFEINTINPWQIAYIIYTSGTTGIPNGVIIEHKALMNYINWAKSEYVSGSKSNFALFTAISYDLCITSIFLPLITGNLLSIYNGDVKDNIENIFLEQNVNILKLTPSHLKLMLALKDNIIPKTNEKLSIKKFIVGGEMLETDTVRKIHKVFQHNIDIYNEYGPTEATVGCMIYKFDPEDDYYSVPIGKAIDNTIILIVNKENDVQITGGMGEIYIGGQSLAKGYINRVELTHSKFPEFSERYGRLYKSGDLARILSDNNIEYKERIDKQIKIRGFRIEIDEIEMTIKKFNYVKDVIIAAEKSDSGDIFIAAYVMFKVKVSVNVLRESLYDELPQYMIPGKIVEISEIPVTKNGKIDFEKLRSLRIRHYKNDVTLSLLEKKIIKIWSDVLVIGEDEINIKDTFFELGGNSLSATVFLTRLQKETGYRVFISEFFKNPTISETATIISEISKVEFSRIPLAEKKKYYQLSDAQKRFYAQQVINPSGVAYNQPQFFELLGDLDIARLEKAVQNLIKRHESLRTSFHLINDLPFQVISENTEFIVEKYEAPDQKSGEQILKNFIRPFKLDKSPLLRLGTLKIEGSINILMFDMHHIITDGISYKILVNDFLCYFDNKKLIPITFHYRYFSEWSIRRNKSLLEKQKKYWLEQFTEKIPVLELPLDFKRPNYKSFSGNKFSFQINKVVTIKLKRIAASYNISNFNFFIGVFYIFLHKITNQRDIVIGTLSAGRNHADLERIVGLFVNTLPVRVKIDTDFSLHEFMKLIKDKVNTAIDNQGFQYQNLVEIVCKERDLSRNPLFDVMFFYEHDNIKNEEKPSLAIAPYKNTKISSKNDLTLTIREAEDVLDCTFEYCTHLFNETTIARFSKYISMIIGTISDSDKIFLSDIKLHSEELNAPVDTIDDGNFRL